MHGAHSSVSLLLCSHLRRRSKQRRQGGKSREGNVKSSKVQIVIVTSGQVVLKHTLRMNWPMRMHSSFQFERAQELSAMCCSAWRAVMPRAWSTGTMLM